MTVPKSFYEFESDGPASVKVKTTDALSILDEVKKRRIYIRSIEGFRIDDDGYWLPDLSISKMGLSGEDDFRTLEQHYAFDEKLFEHAQGLQCGCMFEIWLDDERSLQNEEKKTK